MLMDERRVAQTQSPRSQIVELVLFLFGLHGYVEERDPDSLRALRSKHQLILMPRNMPAINTRKYSIESGPSFRFALILIKKMKVHSRISGRANSALPANSRTESKLEKPGDIKTRGSCSFIEHVATYLGETSCKRTSDPK